MMFTTHRVLVRVESDGFDKMDYEETASECGSFAFEEASEHGAFEFGEIEEVIFGANEPDRLKKELDTALEEIDDCFNEAMLRLSQTRAAEVNKELIEFWYKNRSESQAGYDAWKFGSAMYDVIDCLLGRYTYCRGSLDTESGLGDLDKEFIKEVMKHADEYAIVLLNVHN